MPTRAAAAREAAFVASSTSSTPAKPSKTSKRGAKSTSVTTATKKKGAKVQGVGGGDGQDDVDVVDTEASVAKFADEGSGKGQRTEATLPTRGAKSLPTPAGSIKRKRAAPSGGNSAVNGEPVKGGWDDLPHNMGTTNGGEEGRGRKNEETETAEAKLEPPTKKTKRGAKIKTEEADAKNVFQEEATVKGEEAVDKKIKKEFTKGRGRAKKGELTTPESEDTKIDPITAELKEEAKDEYIKDDKPKKKRASVKKLDTSADVVGKVGELLDTADKPAKKVKKGKKNPYGLTPGESPFPEFARPTVEDCYTVNDLLTAVHGKVEAPKEIPAPSLEVTGCGEVPSVLDALIRTRLSASTTSTNAGYAFAGLVARYDILKEGIGAGSVDWNAVRESDVKDIELAIKKGGLAATKSKSIKAILEMVYQLNTTRADSFVAERDTGVPSTVFGADKLTQGQKDLEIACHEKGVLSLDYMHGLTADDAMIEFVKYPGIGVKTASCVILFCLRRPSFAVDTHVFRLCKWLDWVPDNATRDTAFSHCEVRVPNELKYPLHQLLIRHGKTCGRCRAITGERSEGWENANCPIEHLVKRTGLRKGPPSLTKRSANAKTPKAKTTKSPKKGKKGKKSEESAEDTDMEDEESELTEPELDDEPEDGSAEDSELSEFED